MTSAAEEAAFIARHLRQRVAYHQFEREQRRHRQERDRLLDTWFWDDPASAEQAKRAARLTELLGSRVNAVFGLAAGDELELCSHLADITAAGDYLLDETPARLCGWGHGVRQPVRCPPCADWHAADHRLPQCDGCQGAPADEWRTLDLRLVGVWAANNGLEFGDCVVRVEPAVGLCRLCSALFEQDRFAPLTVQAPP